MKMVSKRNERPQSQKEAGGGIALLATAIETPGGGGGTSFVICWGIRPELASQKGKNPEREYSNNMT